MNPAYPFSRRTTPRFAALALCVVWLSVFPATSSHALGFAGLDVCKPGVIPIPSELRKAKGGAAGSLPTAVEADEFETDDLKKAKVLLTGNAQILQGKYGLYADKIEYDRELYTAKADGSVRLYMANGTSIRSKSIEVETETFTGTALDATIRMPRRQGPKSSRNRRGNFIEDYTMFAPFRRVYRSGSPHEGAPDENTYVGSRAQVDKITFEGESFERLTNVEFTTCGEGDNSVVLKAKEIELDHIAGIGRAINMTLKFKGVPIFYFPITTFPIDNQRKTGFLFPSVAFQDDLGYIFDLPFYINIAPQQDAIVIPRSLRKRGIQLYGRYRYLTKNSRSEVRAEYLPSDDAVDPNQPNTRNDGNRYAIGIDYDYKIGRRWKADMDFQTVSDPNYLSDFSNEVSITASSYVPQRTNLRYRGKRLQFQARTVNYEKARDISTSSKPPHEILPSLAVTFKPYKLGKLEAGLSAELTTFEHEDADIEPSGTRFRYRPHLRLPLRKSYGSITSKVSLQTISYSLEQNPDDDCRAEDNCSASIPIYSLDGKIYFDREFELGQREYSQSLEPRLFYLFIPAEPDQSRFPNFDTGSSSSSSIGQAFRENTSHGGDRVGDPNKDTERLSFGLNSRIKDRKTGKQKINMSLAQEFNLESETAGDLSTRLSANVAKNWSMSTSARIDDETQKVESFRLSGKYSLHSRRNASLSYTRSGSSSNRTEQMNLGFKVPLSGHWQMGNNTAFSITDNEFRSSTVELIYDGCCWVVGLKTRRYIDDGEDKNHFLLTFGLDNFGSVRTRYLNKYYQ